MFASFILKILSILHVFFSSTPCHFVPLLRCVWYFLHCRREGIAQAGSELLCDTFFLFLKRFAMAELREEPLILGCTWILKTRRGGEEGAHLPLSFRVVPNFEPQNLWRAGSQGSRPPITPSPFKFIPGPEVFQFSRLYGYKGTEQFARRSSEAHHHAHV